MNLLKKLPYPIAGTTLGFAALGNLLVTYHPLLKTLCGIISAILVIMILIKIAVMPKNFGDAMGMPLVASSFATYPMAIMILSTYLPKGSMAQTLWLIGFSAHALLIVWFTWRYLMKGFKLATVFPSWFIVYVGIVAGTVSAPYHGYQSLGMAAFWFSLIAYFPLLALVTRRVTTDPMPAPAKPSITIYAAPVSLLLAGYMSSAPTKIMPLVYLLLALSLGLYLFSLIQLPRLLNLPFAPSISSYTFPFVISAIAARSTSVFLTKSGAEMAWLDAIAAIQPWIAAILCIYVLGRYLVFLFQPAPEGQPAPTR